MLSYAIQKLVNTKCALVSKHTTVSKVLHSLAGAPGLCRQQNCWAQDSSDMSHVTDTLKARAHHRHYLWNQQAPTHSESILWSTSQLCRDKAQTELSWVVCVKRFRWHGALYRHISAAVIECHHRKAAQGRSDLVLWFQSRLSHQGKRGDRQAGWPQAQEAERLHLNHTQETEVGWGYQLSLKT